MDCRLKCKPKIKKKSQEKYIGENICGLALGKDFLYLICETWYMKEKLDKLEFIKIRIVLQKTLIREWKDKPQTWRKYLWVPYLIKGRVCIKNSQNS